MKAKAKSSKDLTASDINHLAKLAHLPLSKKEAQELEKQVGVTVAYVSQLKSLSTKDIEETSQVTGLENVTRENEVDVSRMLTQEQALSNVKRTHTGFFVVDAVFNH